MTNRNDVRIRLEDAIDALTATVRRNTAGPNALDPTPPGLRDVEDARGAIRTLVDGLMDESEKVVDQCVREREALAKIYRETIDERDEARLCLDEVDIYLRCRGMTGESVLSRIKRMEHDHKLTVGFWQRGQETIDALQADRDALLRIIGDSFMSLHIPSSAMAFDGRNLVVHAQEASRVAMVLRGERDQVTRELNETRASLASLVAAARSLTEDPNACWEDFLAVVESIGGSR